MLKIIEVNYINNYKLELAFNDGFEGVVDLEDLFTKEPFNQFADQFLSFSLMDGALWWDDMRISPDYLKEIATPCFTGTLHIDPNNPLDVITMAFRESLEENDPTILQANLRGYVEKTGMSNPTKKRNNTHNYLSPVDSSQPKWETIVKLAHSIINLQKTVK
jgi:hypothetical protein